MGGYRNSFPAGSKQRGKEERGHISQYVSMEWPDNCWPDNCWPETAKDNNQSYGTLLSAFVNNAPSRHSTSNTSSPASVHRVAVLCSLKCCVTVWCTQSLMCCTQGGCDMFHTVGLCGVQLGRPYILVV